MLVTGHWQPSQRNGQPKQKELNRDEQCRHYAAGAEQHPEKSLIRLLLRHVVFPTVRVVTSAAAKRIRFIPTAHQGLTPWVQFICIAAEVPLYVSPLQHEPGPGTY